VSVSIAGNRLHQAVIDHLKSSLFELPPEASSIIRAEGAIIRRSSPGLARV
jgi:hypothetical protein